MTDSDLARFEEKVSPEPMSGCWLWDGALRSNGYGHMWLAGRWVGAHRIAYEHWRGPIPEGLHIDHLCRVRSCVNPTHLEPVTCRDNLLRGETSTAAHAAKTHCPAGHPYSEENTNHWHGQRRCRTCDRLRHRRKAA